MKRTFLYSCEPECHWQCSHAVRSDIQQDVLKLGAWTTKINIFQQVDPNHPTGGLHSIGRRVFSTFELDKGVDLEHTSRLGGWATRSYSKLRSYASALAGFVRPRPVRPQPTLMKDHVTTSPGFLLAHRASQFIIQVDGQPFPTSLISDRLDIDYQRNLQFEEICKQN